MTVRTMKERRKGEREQETEKETRQETEQEELRRVRTRRAERRRRERKRGERRRRERARNGVKVQEEQKKEVSAQGEQEITREKEKLRRGEREVKAQEGHDGEEEMATKEKCVEAKKEMNSMHEKNDVSDRHMTWWRDAWWVRMDNGPHLRTARGRRKVWREATRAAWETRETGRVAEREREEWETGSKESNAKVLHVAFHFPNTTTSAPTTAAVAAASVVTTRLQ